MKTISSIIFLTIVFSTQIEKQFNQDKPYYFLSGQLKQISGDYELSVLEYLLLNKIKTGYNLKDFTFISKP